MRLALALGAAFAAMTVAAAALPGARTHVVVRHGGGDINIDANDDGWVTRQEASAAADRIFADLDSNNDGRLTVEDRPLHRAIDIDMDVAAPDGERRVRIVRRGPDGEEVIERELSAGDDVHVEQEIERAQREAEHAARQAETIARDAGARVEREVVIIRQGPGEAPIAPLAAVPAAPPHPPMFMMLIANSEEADLNNDGALSREEFRTQHLRFFDASDANGDGRIRFDPPEPPQAPEPPPANAPEAPAAPAPPPHP